MSVAGTAKWFNDVVQGDKGPAAENVRMVEE